MPRPVYAGAGFFYARLYRKRIPPLACEGMRQAQPRERGNTRMSLQQLYKSADKTGRRCKVCDWYTQQDKQDRAFGSAAGTGDI